MAREETQSAPLGPIKPVINGIVDSYFEWLGAGIYRVDIRSGSMHGKRALVREVRYGASDSTAFLRIDFLEGNAAVEGLEIHAEVAGADGKPQKRLAIRVQSGSAVIEGQGGKAAYKDVMEIALPLTGDVARVRLSFWQDGLPIQAIPPQDYLQISTPTGWNA
jgi:hypothetical protein